MDQDSATPPPPRGSDGKSGIFQKVNAVVAGLTGLVIALGGLAAATKGIVWDKEPSEEQQQQQAVAAQPPEPAAAPKEEEAAARPILFKGDLYNDDDEKFDAGSMQLQHDGERWILTIAGEDEKYRYDELSTANKKLIVATSPDYTSTLRWPVEGGVVEESTKTSRDKWETYGKVEAAD